MPAEPPPNGVVGLQGRYGLLVIRLAGRRVFGKWAALDIIVSIIFIACRGAPLNFAEAGGLDNKALVRHAISRADLTEALHAAGIEDMSRARLVVLEPSGKISVC